MSQAEQSRLSLSHWMIAGLVIFVLIIGTLLVIFSIRQAVSPQGNQPEQVDALASSEDDCVKCHRDENPGVVQQYSYSNMAAAKVAC
jgi:uncharacterized protein YpmB